MNHQVASGIVLSRTNYGEADRIVTLLTPNDGKLSLLARGVRRPKSKLAGGIELFSVSSLTYLRGRGSLGTLVSARLETHYGNIVKHIDRVQLGYDIIKMLNRATEDEPESAYFDLLQTTFVALDNAAVSVELLRAWFGAQLLQLAGHAPNLHTDIAGERLQPTAKYRFDFDSMAFAPDGAFGADHIKLLRLLFTDVQPGVLQQISGVGELLPPLAPLVQTMLVTHIRV